MSRHSGEFWGGPYDGDKITGMSDVILRPIPFRADALAIPRPIPVARYLWDQNSRRWNFVGIER